MLEHDAAFPSGATGEEKTALLWKIGQDYRKSHLAATHFRNEYITFAIAFYTRNRCSMEDVVSQYRAHCLAVQRRSLAEAFRADMHANRHEKSVAL